MECDFDIKEAASGVAVCSTGLLMTGLEGTKGRVEDLEMPMAFLRLDEASPMGNVLVFDNNGIVVVVAGDGVAAVTEVEGVVVPVVVFVGLGVLTLSTETASEAV